MFSGYSEAISSAMRSYHKCLREKDSRHYAAIEAMKIGYGGISYISRLLNVTHKTIRKGISELGTPPPDESQTSSRQRRPGGGRKKNNGSALPNRKADYAD